MSWSIEAWGKLEKDFLIGENNNKHLVFMEDQKYKTMFISTKENEEMRNKIERESKRIERESEKIEEEKQRKMIAKEINEKKRKFEANKSIVREKGMKKSRDIPKKKPTKKNTAKKTTAKKTCKKKRSALAKREGRVRVNGLKESQYKHLLNEFEKDENPSYDYIKLIASEIETTFEKVRNWFGNHRRRMSEIKKKLK